MMYGVGTKLQRPMLVHPDIVMLRYGVVACYQPAIERSETQPT